MRDPVTRHMYEIQILEFGQIPRQLFTKPHPARFAGIVPPPLPSITFDVPSVAEEEEDGVESHTKCWSQAQLLDLQVDTAFQAHKKSVTGVAVVSHGSDLQGVSVSLDGFLKVYRYVLWWCYVIVEVVIFFFT